MGRQEDGEKSKAMSQHSTLLLMLLLLQQTSTLVLLLSWKPVREHCCCVGSHCCDSRHITSSVDVTSSCSPCHKIIATSAMAMHRRHVRQSDGCCCDSMVGCYSRPSTIRQQYNSLLRQERNGNATTQRVELFYQKQIRNATKSGTLSWYMIRTLTTTCQFKTSIPLCVLDGKIL